MNTPAALAQHAAPAGHWPIRTRDWAFRIMAMLLLGCALTFSWQSWRQEQAGQAQVLATVVELGERGIDTYFAQLENGMQGLAFDALEPDGTIDQGRAGVLLDRFHAFHPELADVTLLWGDGQTLTVANLPSTQAALKKSAGPPRGLNLPPLGDVSFEEFRRDGGARHHLNIGRAAYVPGLQQWAVPLRWAMRDGHGRVRYVLNSLLPVEFLQGFWRTAPIADQTRIGLVRDDGYIVSSTPLAAPAEGAEVYDKPKTGALMRFLQQEHFPVRGELEGRTSFTPESLRFSFRRLTHYPLTLVVAQPVSVIWGLWWAKVWIPTLMSALLAGAGLLVFHKAAQRRIQWDAEQRRAHDDLRASAQELRTSQRQLHTIVDNLPESIYLRDTLGRFLIVNSTAAGRFGLKPADLIGRNSAALPLQDPGALRMLTDADSKLRATGAAVEIPELHMVLPGGNERWARVIKVPLRDDQEQLSGILTVSEDITERRRIMETLKQGEENYRVLLEAMGHGVFVAKDGKLLFANSAYATILGYESPAEMLALESVAELVAPEDRQLVFGRNRMRAAGIDPPPRLEYRAVRKNGEVIWVDATVRPIMWQGKRALLGTAVDISDRIRSEKRSRASERLLRTVIDALPLAVSLKDVDGRYQLANRSLLKLYALPEEKFLGSRVRDLPGNKDPLSLVEQADIRVVKTGETVEIPEMTTSQAGASLPLKQRLLKAPLRDDSGAVIGIVTIGEDITERLRSEEKLRSSQLLLQTVVDTVPVSFAVKDREGRYLLVNRRWCDRHGVPPEQALGHPAFDVPGRTDGTPGQSRLDDERVLAGDCTPIVFEGWRSHTDHELRTFQSYKALFYGPGGHVAGLVSATVDITDLKRAQESARASERLLQTVFDTIPHNIVVKDLAGRYLNVNAAWCAVHSVSRAEAVGKDVDIIPGLLPEERAGIVEADRQVLAGEGALVRYDRTLTLPDGSKRHYRDTRAQVRDGDGRVTGIVAVSVDQTEEKNALDRANLAQARLLDAIESLPAGFFLYDAEERLAMWNSRVLELYPSLQGKVRVGMRYGEVVEVTGEVMKRVQDGKEDWVPERRKNIRIRPVPVVEQRLADGRWIHAIDRRTTDGGSTVCLRFDITAAKTQEQALLQAQKLEAVGQLTSGVAHEFNNALQVVSGYVELVAQDLGLAHPLRKDMDEIDKGVRRAADLTKQLLTFTRKHAFQPVPLDLSAVVRNFCVSLGKMLTPNHELRIVAPECPLQVVADRSMIEQVLINFGVNARDAMPAGGRMAIEVGAAEFDDGFCGDHAWARPGRYCLLRFSDTGEGMTPEVMKRVFEPFFTTKDPGKGTGLGLSVVYGIVNQHDGLIRVDSEPGQGTTFEVYLPAA